MSNEEVLDWLRKNRFRQPELSLFMYALIAIAVGFVLYTGETHELKNRKKFVILIEIFSPAQRSLPAPVLQTASACCKSREGRRRKTETSLIDSLTHTRILISNNYTIQYISCGEGGNLSPRMKIVIFP